MPTTLLRTPRIFRPCDGPEYVLYYVHIHSGLWTVRERYSCQNLLENAVRIPRPPRPPWITYQACLNLNDMDSFNRKLVKDINSSMDYTLACYYLQVSCWL